MAKNLKSLVPGKNDFLAFARTMNKNAEVDLAKTGEKVSPTVAPMGAPGQLGTNEDKGGMQ